MDLFEYQARGLLEAHGVPVPRPSGALASTPEQAREAAQRIGGSVVVKAQVTIGGRGKAGGVKLAGTPAQAEAVARSILGMDIRGHAVRSVLVVPAVAIAQEHYASFLLDRAGRRHLAMCSVHGGMDIEQLAREHPDQLARVPIDPRSGVDRAAALRILRAGGFAPERAQAAAPVLERLWEVYRDEDATLVEVNPLVSTQDGRVLALDAKVSLDDNAAFRHPDHAAFRDDWAEDPLEAEARAKRLHYVRLGGQVGVIGNGAGLVMATLDVVADAGREAGIGPANFLDIGGGASAEVMAESLGLVLRDPRVRSVLVNVFGGITACDEVATGVVRALQALGARADKPIVVRLDGNRVAEGREILRRAAHPLVALEPTMDGAARRAVEAAGEAEHVDSAR